MHLHWTHWLGIGGLVLNTGGALMLLRYTGEPFAGSSLTQDQWPSIAMEHWRRLKREVWYFRFALGAIVVGFVAQLLDLLLI
ncbi:MAG: hypothetical protein ABI645_00505 [Pseudomonadota bacterium]